jgi:hypothetical protein
MLTLCFILRLRGGGYPPHILYRAAALNNDNENVRNILYPFYLAILDYWFPAPEGYDIGPMWPIPGRENIVDSTITFVILLHEQVLLLIEVNAPSDFYLDAARDAALSLVLRRFDEIGPNNRADRLYAVSAFGKRWRACLKGGWRDNAEPVDGVGEVNSLESANPTCWNPDITSDASWVALQSIVEMIKGNVEGNVTH